MVVAGTVFKKIAPVLSYRALRTVADPNGSSPWVTVQQCGGMYDVLHVVQGRNQIISGA